MTGSSRAPGWPTIGLEAVLRPVWPAGMIYIRNLVNALAALPPDEAPTVRLLPLDVASYKEAADLERLPFVEMGAPRFKSPQLLGNAFRARRALRKLVQPRIRTALAPSYRGLDLTYPDWGDAIPGTPQVHWIPDLQHVHLPQMFTEEELDTRDRWVRRVADSPSTAVFSSEAALNDFHALFPQPKVTPRVWRFCTTITEEEMRGRDPRTTFGLPDTYIYIGNQFWAHKDHLTAFRALALLREEGLRPTFVCTGRLEDYRDPTYVDSVKSFLSDNGLEDQVKVLGFLERADQIQVLRNCAAVLQPSLFEGWSTVVEDAKAIGRPIVISDIAVHKEQVPDAAFFEAGSAESLAACLREVLGELTAGPDPEAERRAFERSAETRLAAARSFMRIALEVASR